MPEMVLLGMRALIYSDLQATDGHERCFSDPTRSLQLHRLELFFNALDKIAKEQRCDALWDLGDTTDDRNAIPVPVIDLLCDRLEHLVGGGHNLKLVGNHEQYLRDTRIHVGKMFRRYFDVVEDCQCLTVENVNILCVSYHDDPEAVIAFLRRQRVTQKPTVVLGHFQVAGCQMTGGLAATGIARSELDFARLSLLGHIHKPQTLGKINYVGSPFQQDWGEAGESKRVGLLDLNRGEVKLQWVPLTGFPEYRQVSLASFIQEARPESEDRFKVVLKSVAETEAFYAHPLAHRADEVLYDYQTVAASPGAEAESDLPRTKQDILRRYVALNPPQAWNLELSAEELLAFGEQITNSV